MMCLLVGLAFMQWRRKVEPLSLPSGTAIAPLALRLGAMAIDLAISYIIVLVVFSAWENGGYIGLAESWITGMQRPEDMFTSAPFLVFVGIYLGHVTVGEMFFRRSVGKAFTGLQVLMLDGKSPTVAAILVRNLVRLPELPRWRSDCFSPCFRTASSGSVIRWRARLSFRNRARKRRKIPTNDRPPQHKSGSG